MKIIDMDNYPRRSHFEYFNSLAYPYMVRLAMQKKSETIGFFKRFSLMNSGYKNYKKLISYDEWKKR